MCDSSTLITYCRINHCLCQDTNLCRLSESVCQGRGKHASAWWRLTRSQCWLCVQATFVHNSAAQGGAICADGDSYDTVVTLLGRTVMKGNTAAADGGALSVVSAARLNVTGPLCAINNTVSAGTGGFLFLNYASAVFPEQGDVSISSTAAGDITLSDGASLKCGGSDTSWVNNTSYTVEGPVCGCNAAFQDPQGDTVCRSCALGFDVDTCACKVGHPDQKHPKSLLQQFLQHPDLLLWSQQ